jgi:hypothetical protein
VKTVTEKKHAGSKPKRITKFTLCVLLISTGLLVMGLAVATAGDKPVVKDPPDDPHSFLGWSFRKQQAQQEAQVEVANQTIPEPTQSLAGAEQTAGGLPEWLEPRGLSIVELVGLVPDEYLRGTILAYNGASGIAVYEAGSRVGSTVVVSTTIYPRFFTPSWAPDNRMTRFTCLGQIPVLDIMGIVVPESTLRIYDSTGHERTGEIKDMFVSKMGTLQPLAGSGEFDRYPMDHYGRGGQIPLQIGPDGLVIPPNSGCHIQLHGAHYYPLTGVFTFNFDPLIRASVLGTQQASFQSYIGPGDVGLFRPLMNQLEGRYDWRHGRIPLQVPVGANYLIVKYPPMPADPYTDQADGIYDNLHRLTSGCYRQVGEGDALTAGVQFSAALPVDVTWLVSDWAPGSKFLPLVERPRVLAPLEYIVPAGVAYNDCFRHGNCPASILQQIYNAEMDLEIIYLSVSLVAAEGQWTSLRMAGPAWSPSVGGGTDAAWQAQVIPDTVAETSVGFGETGTMAWKVFFPFVTKAVPTPTNCPCGLFDSLGRMLYPLP